MPTRPPTHHPHPHGRALVNRRYDATQRDPALARIRSSARWQRLRSMILARDPLCADPYGAHAHDGRVEPATQVDHVVPLQEDAGLAFDADNLQGLCTACHGRKSHFERAHRGGGG